MSQKAKLFKDEDSLKLIMQETDPKKQKTLGKKIEGFKQQDWREKAKTLCYRGIEAKVLQNPYIKKQLIATGNRKIREANPHDTFFGIGLHLNDKRVTEAKNWRGKNIMGQILEEVRACLK